MPRVDSGKVRRFDVIERSCNVRVLVSRSAIFPFCRVVP